MSISAAVRRVLVCLVTVSLGVLALGACGSAAPAPKASGGAVTIKHKYGSTTINGVPKRIVTLDLQWSDAMLALGVRPVAYGGDPMLGKGGRAPWQDKLAGATQLGMRMGKSLPMEKIAAQRPDLIVGSYMITSKDQYEKLSKIAPTIPYLDDRQVERWTDVTRTAGRVLHDAAGAKRIISGVDDRVSAARAKLSGLKGKTFVLAQYIVGDSLVAVADPSDGSSVFFRELGMKQLPSLVAEGKKSKQARVQVSTERLDLLRSDVLFFLINGGTKADLKDLPGWKNLPAVKAGDDALLDYPTATALNTPTPLSIPAALGKLMPVLKDAARA